MTTERTRSSILAARFARAMPKTSPLFKSEGAGKTGCPPAPVGPRAKKLRERREDHRWRRRTLRPSLRSGFTAYFVLLGEPMLVCHRRLAAHLWSKRETWRQRRGARTTRP